MCKPARFDLSERSCRRARAITSWGMAQNEGRVLKERDAGKGDLHLGRAVRRIEDADLLRGYGRFANDLPTRPGTLHAVIVRSPHAFAEILSVDANAALAIPGVECVVTGDDARRWTKPFGVAVKTAMEHWCLAIEKVRYVGEPVAVALARDRNTAEDAAERVAVSYRPLPPVVGPEAATQPDAPLLHRGVRSNVVSNRSFCYGDPEVALATAPNRVSVTVRYPRNAGIPIECFVVIAEYLPGEGVYEVFANKGRSAWNSGLSLAARPMTPWRAEGAKRKKTSAFRRQPHPHVGL
jgi:2-furoyl-CoA dehydrogenase large subunit